MAIATAPERPGVQKYGAARAARDSVTEFLGDFEHDKGWMEAWQPVREKIKELERDGRLTRDEARLLDEQAFWASCRAACVVADRWYESLARANFPEALRHEPEPE